MVGWKCSQCINRRLSNPSRCKNCGSTILQQHRQGSRWSTWLVLLVGIAIGAALVLGWPAILGGVESGGALGGGLSPADDSNVTSTSAPTSTRTIDYASAGETPQPTAASGSIDRRALELAIHARINKVRNSHGRDSLEYSRDLRDAARLHSTDMADRGYFAHVGPDGSTFEDRYAEVGYDCRVSIGDGRYVTGAENIAKSTILTGNETAVAQRIVAGWMQSDGHRENILKQFWRVEAIGVTVAGNSVYVTQNFC